MACSFWLLVIHFKLLYLPSICPESHFFTNKQRKTFCSQQKIELLTTKLLLDLPSYANRVIQRARRTSRKTDVFSYILVAGRPEFTPLPLISSGDIPKELKDTAKDVNQVFLLL